MGASTQNTLTRGASSGLSRREQGEQTRRAIVQAAVELYAEAGVRGTGLIAIGERAGVHHATVLYHYRSSKELLLAVLAERDRQFLAFMQDAWRGGGLEALASLPMVARFNLEKPVWAKLFTVLQAENLDASAEVHAYFLERRRTVRELLIGLLQEAKRRGQIRQDVDEETTADTVLSFTAGLQIQYFLDPRQVDPLAACERFTAMLLESLGASPGPSSAARGDDRSDVPGSGRRATPRRGARAARVRTAR